MNSTGRVTEKYIYLICIYTVRFIGTKGTGKDGEHIPELYIGERDI